EFVRLPRESRYNPIPIHHTRRTERDGEIPVSWILRKLFKTILATQFFDNITIFYTFIENL
ncbi:hypothetical protein, partial [Alistipes putredinis]